MLVIANEKIVQLSTKRMVTQDLKKQHENETKSKMEAATILVLVTRLYATTLCLTIVTESILRAI